MLGHVQEEKDALQPEFNRSILIDFQRPRLRRSLFLYGITLNTYGCVLSNPESGHNLKIVSVSQFLLFHFGRKAAIGTSQHKKGFK